MIALITKQWGLYILPGHPNPSITLSTIPFVFTFSLHVFFDGIPQYVVFDDLKSI